MNAVIKASLALVISVAVLSLLLAFSGLSESSPILAQFAFLIPAIVLNLGCVFWGLKMTAGENSYVKQLANGALIGVIAGVLIFAFSYWRLTGLLPDYLEQTKQATIGWLESQSSIPQTALDLQIAQVEATTVGSQAMGGLIGTFVTSLIAAAIIAIFLRKK